MIPNTFIIGAQKAGTSYLYSLLLQHPDVSGGQVKEPGFFSRHYDRGIDWYSSLYPGASESPILVDASTTYALAGLYPETPARIANACPSARFIYIIRNPYRRIESSWMQLRSQGLPVSRDFNRAVREEPLLIEGSRYWTNLTAYLGHGSPSRVLLLFFDDLIRSPLETVTAVCEFLQIDPADGTIDISSGAKNASLSKVHPNRLLDAAHSFEYYSTVRRVLSPEFRSRLGRLMKRPLENRPLWEPTTLEWARQHLGEESRRILEYGGRDPDIWRVNEA